ncbi:MAG: sulfite exporter TauE/SafE family protein [Alphaproteobacteria bacterium]|nr:sulfite exporter TauE/SafE family protein [Alphaproteobacteria bacterium]
MWIAIVSGVLIGAIMGLMGAGGGILTVPVLVAGLDWSMQQAAPVALVAVTASAVVGAIDGFRHRLVRYKAAMLMATCGIPMTHFGQIWANALPQHLLMAGFAALMLMVARRFYRQALQQTSTSDDVLYLAFIHETTGKFIWTPLTALVLSCIGLFTGLMTGLLGVGGGFLIVPLMRRFTNLSLSGIVATSLFLISLVSGGGVISALLSGAVLPAMETSGFVAAMVSGMLIGRFFSRRLDPKQVQLGFAILLLALSVYLFYRAWGLYANTMA